MNSLGFIGDGIYTLDNRCPNMPFDYAGQGQAGNDYPEDDYDYTRTDKMVIVSPVEDWA